MSVPIDSLLLDRPFAIDGPEAFNALALDLFHLHAAHNPVYRGFLSGLGRRATQIDHWTDIPCLPIGLFRSQNVAIGAAPGSSPIEGGRGMTFTSSGTTGAVTSKHHVPWPGLYERSFTEGFRRAFGEVNNWRILALLPSYLERSGSSLVYMAEHLIRESGDPMSGTYLNQYGALHQVLVRSEEEGKRTMLLGVPFALLDMAERHPMPLRNTVLVETGGMKGRRPEMVRDELHGILQQAFQLSGVHSEYGMTELLSQAWSNGRGLYQCPPWMQVRVRDVNDPFAHPDIGRTGGIDVIDLCNIGSCPFISTQDLGRMHDDGTFDVLGRFDNSDMRGCNLLVED
ncbi:MAG: acyl transferase [Flavobacteriales bacterium]